MDGYAYYGEPVAENAGVSAPWTRLYRGAQAVGFGRPYGDRTFYSRDGYAWSGEAIPHDGRCLQTGLRDRANRRVFHLERVQLRRRGRALSQRCVALESRQYGTLLWSPETGDIHRLYDLRAEGRVAIDRVLDTLHGQPHWVEAADLAMARYQPRDPPGVRDVALSVSTALVGVALGAWLSVAMSGSVGAGATLLGLITSQWLMLYVRVKRDARWLTRFRLLRLALWSGLASGALTFFFRLSSASGVAALGLGIAMVICSGLATLLTGDVVAWSGGGFAGEHRVGAAVGGRGAS